MLTQLCLHIRGFAANKAATVAAVSLDGRAVLGVLELSTEIFLLFSSSRRGPKLCRLKMAGKKIFSSTQTAFFSASTKCWPRMLPLAAQNSARQVQKHRCLGCFAYCSTTTYFSSKRRDFLQRDTIFPWCNIFAVHLLTNMDCFIGSQLFEGQ